MRMRIFVAALVGIGSGMVSNALAATLGAGDAPPPMKVFRWIKGAPVTEFDPGKIYVVEFWATWCASCKSSASHLTSLSKKYRGKITFVGISVAEEQDPKLAGKDTSYVAKVRQFVKDEGDQMDYSVGTDSPTTYMGSNWMAAAGMKDLPTAFVVVKGKIAWIGIPSGELDVALDQMVAGKFDYEAEREREAELKAKKEADEKQVAGIKLLAAYGDAMKRHDLKAAVAEVEKLMEGHPDQFDLLVRAKFEALAIADPASANAYVKEAAAGDAKTNPEVLNSLAWAMVDDSDPIPGMDTVLAESVAAQAISLLDPKEVEYAETLDTLALAQFKNGKQGDALATETKAIELYSRFKSADPETLKEMRGRLAKYQAAKT